MNIHLVYEEEYIEQLKEILLSEGHDIVEKDYSLSQFANYAEKGQAKADVAIVDGQAGVVEKREIIEHLTVVRKNLPNLRLILILPESFEKDEVFISKLLSLSLYDMYFRDEYHVDDLKSWLSKPKSYADYNIETSDVTGQLGEKPKFQRLPVTDKTKVLLAAGENLADRLDNDDIKIVANVALREKIIPTAEKLKPDVVILSVYLRGSTDYLEIAERLVSMNIRLIFLAGDLSPGSIEINKMKEMGVKEILYNPVDLGQLEKMTIRPDPSGEIVFKEPGKRGMFSAFLSQPSKIKTSGTPKAETSSITLFSKTVFIWSPVSSGKTTVALNLSAYAAKMGYQVALIDADPSCALHTYTKGVNDGQYLAEALLDDPYAVAHTITLIPELLIFTNDPNTDYPIITERNLRKLAGILEENNDLVVVDMPSNTGLMQKLPDVQILLVADQNWHHIKQIQRSLDEGWLPDNIKLILNNYFDSGEIPVQEVEKALGQINVSTIPSRTKELTEGIKTGIPAVLFDKPLLQGFSSLIKEIKEG